MTEDTGRRSGIGSQPVTSGGETDAVVAGGGSCVETAGKYPLVDHMNSAYAMGLFGLPPDGGDWGIRAIGAHAFTSVDGGYFSEAYAAQSIRLMRSYGIDTPVEIVRKVGGEWVNVW